MTVVWKSSSDVVPSKTLPVPFHLLLCHCKFLLRWLKLEHPDVSLCLCFLLHVAKEMLFAGLLSYTNYRFCPMANTLSEEGFRWRAGRSDSFDRFHLTALTKKDR